MEQDGAASLPTQPSSGEVPPHPACPDHGQQTRTSNGKKKKQKNRGKTAASRGPTALPKSRGTGFEEYYADPPMTPNEACEEKYEIYNEDYPFEERIQSCIQRFRSRRRLQGKQTLYFNEYLFLGGIDTGNNAFGGQDPRDLKELTPAERREALATDMVHGGSASGERFYTGDREHWSVDFTGVAAGFFSITMISFTCMEKGPLEMAIGVVQNFLRYVLQHDVCPEYEEDVKRAVQVCDDAREQWPMLARIEDGLPGQFNLAAAKLFGQHEESDWFIREASLLQMSDAKAVFFSSLALTDDNDVFARVSKPGATVIRKFDCDLQIKRILRPMENVVQRFQQMCLDDDRAHLQPVGKIICTPTTIEDGYVHQAVPSPLGPDEEVTLYFDDWLLADMKEGMKLGLTLCELDSGLRFVKTLRRLLPTFYTFLPQELMRHFKPPKEDERPAPSVHNQNENDGDSAGED